MNLTIRECLYKDLDYIVDLQQQWSKEEITYGFMPADKDHLETKLGKYFLVAELNNEIAGFVCGTINKADNISVINNGETYIEVEDIYTAKDNRGKNIGTLLLDRVLEVAKENGARNSN